MKKIFASLLALLLLLSPAAYSKPDYGEFLSDLGYEVSDFFSETDLTLPENFDSVYENYNALQKECGFDLFPYRGERCKIYTYEIYNHPFGACRANLIVHGGEIIGGDISSVSLSGFMTGLE